MRWSQGKWSEDQLITAVRDTNKYVAIPYGPSHAQQDPRSTEVFWDRIQEANPEAMKRPDLLIVSVDDLSQICDQLSAVAGAAPLYPNMVFVPDRQLGFLLDKAFLAVECENSLWIAKQMRNFATPLRPQRRLGGKPGLPTSAVVPRIWIKDEDLPRLIAWQTSTKIPIHSWQVFYDIGFGASLDLLTTLIADGEVVAEKQAYSTPGPQAKTKLVYRLPFYLSGVYEVCRSTEPPELQADKIIDPSGHILPFVRFVGGKLELVQSAIDAMDQLVKSK